MSERLLKPCPPNWRPGCICNSMALDPNELCTVHGGVFDPMCAWCGQFISYTAPCKRCGNDSHVRMRMAARS